MSNSNIIPGAEPFYIEGSNDVGVLVLHGFTSTPQVVGAYGEQLAAEGGFTISAPLLAGHGTQQEDLLGVTALDWIRSAVDAADALQARCSRVFITGQSLGGPSHSLHDSRLPRSFCRGYSDQPRLRSCQMLTERLRSLTSMAQSNLDNGEPDIKKPNVFEIVYESMPMASYRELFGLLGATHAMLPRITCRC